MIKNLVTFAATFAAGALMALAVRSAMHEPYAPAQPPAAPAYAAGHDPAAATPDHAAHAEAAPVNSVCAICGMQVDAKVPPAMYQGKVIGFGCKRCPAEFAANPDLYGPAALANKVVE